MAARSTVAPRRPEREDWDDGRLIQACRDGDQEAWSVLIHRYRRLIYSIPARYGAQPADAADIFQAVCLELYAELPRLRKVESLRSWLISVTAHQAFHWKRRAVKRVSNVLPDKASTNSPSIKSLPAFGFAFWGLMSLMMSVEGPVAVSVVSIG